jgi:hypothetical protein
MALMGGRSPDTTLAPHGGRGYDFRVTDGSDRVRALHARGSRRVKRLMVGARTRRCLVAALSAALVAHGPVHAQLPTVWDDLQPGSRVRVNGLFPTPRGSVPYEFLGVVARFDTTHLYLKRIDRTSIDTLPFFAMQHLEMSTGFAGRSDLQIKGALAGAIMGGAIWALMKAAANNEANDALSDGTISPNNHSPYRSLQRAALVSIPVLGLGGFLIGSATDREQWIAVSIPIP